MSDVFVRAAEQALAEAGDPTAAAAALHAPARITRKPAPRAKRVAWAASQIAAHAATPARAYKALHELVDALFEPIEGMPPASVPAPEVAVTLSIDEVLDELAPPPRVLAHELAVIANLDAAALLADAEPARRILGIRAIAPTALATHAPALATIIASDTAVAADALVACGAASERARSAIAKALQELAAATPRVRAAAIEALETLRVEVDRDRAAALMADADARVRAATVRVLGRGAFPEPIVAALIAMLADREAAACSAALVAVARDPALHERAFAALCKLCERSDLDARPAVYALARHRTDARVVPALQACVRRARSDTALAAAVVLRELDAAIPELSTAERVARAGRELAAGDLETIAAGIQEARRLGEDARPHVGALLAIVARFEDPAAVQRGEPAGRRLTPRLAPILDAATVAAHARAALEALEVDLAPPPTELEPHDGIAPAERAVHGAYVIAATPNALGLWDRGTGRPIVVVDDARLLELVPGRAELAVVRTAPWTFERYAIPSGERLAQLAIPEAFTHGEPARLAIAAGLATVWCDHPHAPYRFHVKLGSPDHILDEAPVPGRRAR